MTGTAFDDWRVAGKRLDHRGHSIFFRAGGNGGASETLLLIHGFPTASWDWHALWEPLCKRFARVLAPDMIGFGWSDKPRDYAYSLFDQADLHEALLLAHGVTRYHVLAHDLGDTVAQELLARHEVRRGTKLPPGIGSAGPAAGAPELASICFLNGGLFPEMHRPRLVQKLLNSPLGPLVARLMNERAFRRSFPPIFGARTKPTADELGELWRLIAYRRGQLVTHKLIRYIDERRVNRERWVGALLATRLPVRVIDGIDDPVSGGHMLARFRELAPGADLVELPGIGHYPQVEDSAGTLRAFLAFHDRLATAAR